MDRANAVLLMLLSVLLVSVSVFVYSTLMRLCDISLGKDSGVFTFWEIVVFVFWFLVILVIFPHWFWF